jgi:hypothetical protein
MNELNLIMDSVTYRVRVVYNSMVNEGQLIEGVNHGDMLSGRHERDLQGTKYPYKMQVEPDPRYPQDFDDFFTALTSPVDTHTVTLPYDNDVITYDAMIDMVSRTYAGKVGGRRRWKNMSVSYFPQSLQRVPT